MCEASRDIDEFIEYELTRDCEEEDLEDQIEDETETMNDQTMHDINNEGYEIIKEEDCDDDIEEIQFSAENEEDDLIEEDESKFIVTMNEPPQPTLGPRRYLLFDELVANIVDYDDEQTPIVEFSMSTEADESLPVECGICPDVMHKSKLAKHLKTHLVEGSPKRYACIYCEETYKEHKYLAGHARRHMGIRPYVCEPCKLYFSTKQDLRVHNQRRHMARDHVCEFCGKTFPQNTQLKRHRESTHEKKRRFQCEHCPKAYYKNFTLQEHIRHVHMGKRRMLTCPFCGMQCHDAHKMARHRKQFHLNQNHFECAICQEEFTDINYFDAHKRSIQCRNNTRRKIELEETEQQQQIQLAVDEQQLPIEEIEELNEETAQQVIMDGQLVYEITLTSENN